jgi:hypothetical protein
VGGEGITRKRLGRSEALGSPISVFSRGRRDAPLLLPSGQGQSPPRVLLKGFPRRWPRRRGRHSPTLLVG